MSLPDSAQIDVSPLLARSLLKRAESLPRYDNREFYSTAVQDFVLDSVRKESADGFDELIGQVRARITRWPFYVLIRGLSFDEGNKVFVAIDLALENEGAELSGEMLNALAAFEDVIGRTDRTSDFLMREGELLFSDNHRTIHARTPISDLENSSRLMIRSWIRTS